MNETRTYADGYRAIFAEERDFLTFLKNIGNNAFWMKKKAKDLKLVVYEEGSRVMAELKDLYAKTGMDEGILVDTFHNTRLLLRVRGNYYPVRNCAVQSILNRVGISGPTLKKLDKDVYARILNACLKAAGGDVLIRVSEGKVSGVMSGDFHDYSVMDMEQVFLHTVRYLKDNFKDCTYVGGFYEHSMASSVWELSGESLMLEAYKKELALHGTSAVPDMKPVIRVATSDVGTSGANIYPMLSYDAGRSMIPLGGPLYLQHKNNAGLAQYDEQLGQIYGKYQVALEGIAKLLRIEISHPVSCMKGVMKKVGIPVRYRAEAAELFECQYGTDACTAHELYYGIAEVIYMMQCNGEPGSAVAAMEEKVARTLNLDWAAYDIPGGN